MDNARRMLRDSDWKQLEPLLPQSRKDKRGRPPKDNRLMIEGILWVFRTGAPWRDLHPGFGPWKTVYNRFNRWTKSGVWDSIWGVLKKRCRPRITYPGLYSLEDSPTCDRSSRR